MCEFASTLLRLRQVVQFLHSFYSLGAADWKTQFLGLSGDFSSELKKPCEIRLNQER